MIAWLSPRRFVLVLAAITLLAGAGGSAAAASPWRLAITIDDIPMTAGGACRTTDIQPVNAAILDALDQFHVRATGFVVPGAACQGGGGAAPSALAALWRSRGHEIGNHTFSHPDYNSLNARDYLSDAERAHGYLEPILTASHQAGRWFRPPLLHAGADRERRAALDAWLAAHDYRMGVVTIDNQEWVFAAAYQRAKARNDIAMANRIVEAYIAHIEASAEYYRALSRQLFDREIPQVLLLHANQLNAERLPALLAALESGGAQFVGFGEALADPAYNSPDEYIGPRGLSWLQRWALSRGVTPEAEPREPDWISVAAQAE